MRSLDKAGCTGKTVFALKGREGHRDQLRAVVQSSRPAKDVDPRDKPGDDGYASTR